MGDLANQLKEKAERMSCEMKEFAGDMNNEIRQMRSKVERFSNEIKQKFMK